MPRAPTSRVFDAEADFEDPAIVKMVNACRHWIEKSGPCPLPAKSKPVALDGFPNDADLDFSHAPIEIALQGLLDTLCPRVANQSSYELMLGAHAALADAGYPTVLVKKLITIEGTEKDEGVMQLQRIAPASHDPSFLVVAGGQAAWTGLTGKEVEVFSAAPQGPLAGQATIVTPDKYEISTSRLSSSLNPRSFVPMIAAMEQGVLDRGTASVGTAPRSSTAPRF